MIYLQDNPLLREPRKPEHIKNRLEPLGSKPWPRIRLYSPEPVGQKIRAGYDLSRGTRFVLMPATISTTYP